MVCKLTYFFITVKFDNNCECYVCKNFSQGYINHLFKAKEILSNTLATYHNLYFFKKMMDEIRESIEDGGFVELKKKWLERN